jgi:peptidoglycan/LPS O-acetylase OafA/YrhL
MAAGSELDPVALKRRRIPTLDGWRAVAIISVLCAHIRRPQGWLAISPELGNWGVQLFFALSGFLITARLLEEYDQRGQIRWSEFYIRRAFRILPPAFFVLSVLAVLGLGMHLIPMNSRQILASVFFVRNYAGGHGWYTAHFWSLAVEEQFYLLWPAILCLVGVSRGGRIAVALACAAAVWRLLDTHFDWIAHFQPELRGDYHRTDYCIGQLFWGCSLAFLWRSKSTRRALRRVVRDYWVLGVLVVQSLLFSLRPRGYEAGMEVLIAVLPLITVADPTGPLSRLLETRPFLWIGTLSYSVYLWQQLFLQSAVPQRALGWIPGMIGILILTFLAAAVSYYFVERPFIQFGRRLQRIPQGSLKPALMGPGVIPESPGD